MVEISSGLRASALAIGVNAALAAGKIVTGIIGNSYALIADGIESTADIISSVVVWSGLRLSAKPPDAEHPYGHGKAEPIAAMLVAVMLLAAAVLIAVQSVHEIRVPHHAPAWFTLVVLAAVIAIKETLFRLRRADRSGPRQHGTERRRVASPLGWNHLYRCVRRHLDRADRRTRLRECR